MDRIASGSEQLLWSVPRHFTLKSTSVVFFAGTVSSAQNTEMSDRFLSKVVFLFEEITVLVQEFMFVRFSQNTKRQLVKLSCTSVTFLLLFVLESQKAGTKSAVNILVI